MGQRKCNAEFRGLCLRSRNNEWPCDKTKSYCYYVPEMLAEEAEPEIESLRKQIAELKAEVERYKQREIEGAGKFINQGIVIDIARDALEYWDSGADTNQDEYLMYRQKTKEALAEMDKLKGKQ